ncbi:gamma-glutamyltransferase family protein [Cohaesibacter celericrescens]|uniref:Gamma-glutamyltransferase n=1 Tax=Cohaesibacter celericrescens TaxID=2067669 RepID=A0A2N5XUW9_9HYPH|nr:gamma-glutamyltransferase family protein [Cohaesibacter celericrescens]PLW78312.1 gamma-glutamyltransferase [Cohaesibacter celericrescens]
MVTSPCAKASKAGADILKRGGNAIEAGVAMAGVLAVTQPHFCGIGGDAVWMVADDTGRRTSLLGIGQAARDLTSGHPIATRGQGSTLTTACAVDSWSAALSYSKTHWSGSLNLGELLEPAILFATEGYAVSPSQVHWLDFRAEAIAGWPGFSEIFMPSGQAPEAGSLFRQPQLGKSLEAIAMEGARTFYEGELGARIAAGLKTVGSPLTQRDLADTRTRCAQPIHTDYRGITLLAPPAPTQGITTLQAMGVLSAFDVGRLKEGGADHFHLAVEAIKQAFLERSGVADPDYSQCDMASMLSAANLQKMAGGVSSNQALAWPHLYRQGDTVHFAVTDASGRCVSVLQSIYYDWGSGVIAGDTGILWQNRGAAFSTDPTSPNALQSGKRPFYTLNPGIALKGDKPYLLYGTQGADGQPQTLVMLLSRLIDFEMAPLDALRRPRFLLGKTFSDSSDSLKIEADAGEETLSRLAAMGHQVSPIEAQSPLAGQAGIIHIDQDGWVNGAHDTRSDGAALKVG